MIKPIGDRLLVERVPRPTKTAGGIDLPDIASNDQTSEYFVVAVGDGKKIKVASKDFVLASTYAGKEIQQGNRKLRLIDWDEALATVTHTTPKIETS